MRCLALFLAALPFAASAGVEEVVADHILPGHAAFADSTEVLAATADTACTGPEIKAAYQDAFDAWIGVSHIQFGPIEDDGLSLAIAFWPDPKNRTGKALGQLISAEDPVVEDPVAFTEVSVAAQGLFSLERMLYDAPGDGEYACALTRAIALELARNASGLAEAWVDYAPALTQPGNERFRNAEEAQRAVYTALSSGLEFLKDQRLGRPLGTFDRPRPTRAEARRSGRSLRNVTLTLEALRDLARAFSDGPIPETEAAFEKALKRANALGDPILAGVAEPAGRIRVEALQQEVGDIRVAVTEEIGAPLGISAGFNSLDGD